MANSHWDLNKIKIGIDRFIDENKRPPTGADFDAITYLPSARQVQRAFGGLPELRKALGYTQLDFTKGELRKAIALQAFSDGLAAEERLELLLVTKFGEPFVHTQKRYAYGTKSRYDFFIYAQDVCFGIDVFTVTRRQYIGNNIRHKIPKYTNAPGAKVIFVALGEGISEEDIELARQSTLIPLSQNPHMSLMNEHQLIRYIAQLQPLVIPTGFIGISE